MKERVKHKRVTDASIHWCYFRDKIILESMNNILIFIILLSGGTVTGIGKVFCCHDMVFDILRSG